MLVVREAHPVASARGVVREHEGARFVRSLHCAKSWGLLPTPPKPFISRLVNNNSSGKSRGQPWT